MKIRYMIDCIVESGGDEVPRFKPVGVWVQGSGPGLDIEMFYVEGKDERIDERREAAEWVINRLVENNITSLPEDFLEYHRDSRSPYDGAFTEIVTSEQYGSLRECGRAILSHLEQKALRR
jgi:hypothetical protein